MAQNPEARTLLIESWTLYSIATTFTICRLYVSIDMDAREDVHIADIPVEYLEEYC